jgi:dGTPase
MAGDLGLDPDVVDLACLAHDLGHPPFGHNGERALNDWASDFGGFEGNAQTLRLLTRIEPKVFGDSGVSYGLNLSRAALDATCKYPWSRNSDSGSATAKFGYYEDDAPVYEWMRIGAPEGVKCIEARVMDFADDVAYSVHDFEDAIVSEYIKLDQLNDSSNETSLIASISDWNGGKYSTEALANALLRLSENHYWPKAYAHTPEDLGRLKNLTSSLIGSFVQRTMQASAAGEEEIITRFNSHLTVPLEVQEEIAVLKGTVAAFLMTNEKRRPVYEWQRSVLTELCDALLVANGDHLDAYAAGAWRVATTEAERYRAIVDQVACLTDQSAITMHHKLVTKDGVF